MGALQSNGVGNPAHVAALTQNMVLEINPLERIPRFAQRQIELIDICDGNMQEGSFRCDANVSVRRVGDTKLGTRTELKNLNTIKGVERGVTAEIARQRAKLEAGERIVQATLLFDAERDAFPYPEGHFSTVLCCELIERSAWKCCRPRSNESLSVVILVMMCSTTS